MKTMTKSTFRSEINAAAFAHRGLLIINILTLIDTSRVALAFTHALHL